VPVRKCRDSDGDIIRAPDPLRPRRAGSVHLSVRNTFALHVVDELNQFTRRTQLPEELVAHTEVRGRVSSEGEEAGDAGVEGLSDDAGLIRNGGSRAPEMRHWVHTAGKNFARYFQRRLPR
jgi:hypothetical protein